MNIRKLLYIKNKVVDKHIYFTIYHGGSRIEENSLYVHVSEYKHLLNYYKIKLLSTYKSLVPYEGQRAYVVRYYSTNKGIVDGEGYPTNNTCYAFCKVEKKDIYFFILKSQVKKWIKQKE